MTVLVDTSVWIQHFREGDEVLARLLSDGLVLTHPFVIGELACGNLKNRQAVLSDLISLPSAIPAANPEVVQLIEDRKLWGRGLGFVHVSLLASALLSDCHVWSLDKPLNEAALKLGLRR